MGNKAVLVTGASSGIGKTIAQMLKDAGYHVYAASRKVVTGNVVDGITHLQMDVHDEQSVQRAFEFIATQDIPLHGVVNSAGLGMTGAVEFTSDAEARELFDTNVFGVLNVCRAAMPLLRENKGGYIINITSIAAQMGLPFRGIYCSSKFAVEGFTESLSLEAHRFGIKACLIEPGDFRTNINANRKKATRNDYEVYNDLHDHILRQINHEVSNAPTPEALGKKVIAILRSSHPRLRHRVASRKALLSFWLMRVLPSRWFEAVLRKYYKL